jgi:hypothetical protein
MARCKWSWTKFQLEKLDKVKVILDELIDYKPLTLRQVYYQLVGKGFIDNTKSEYNGLSKLLKWSRLDNRISWNDIEDRVRVYNDLSGWYDKSHFLRSNINWWFDQYSRDLWQSQGKYIEVWIEKDALSSIFSKVCEGYGVSVVVCRGFSSVSFLHDFKNRLVNHEGKEIVMLYFGDFDPSGNEMLESMKITLKDELGINDIQFKRIALLKDDIFTYKLPNNPDALKKTDTRAKKHLEAYGSIAFELDALRPDVLEKKIENAIKDEIKNIKAFNAEINLFSQEQAELMQVKNRVVEMITQRGVL